MTAILGCALGGLAAWAHFTIAGRVVFGALTVWQAWFLCTFMAAGLAVKEWPTAAAWLVMGLATVASYTAWRFGVDPVLDLAVKNLAVVLLLVLIDRTDRRLLAAAGLYAAVILAGVANAVGLLPPLRARPPVFLWWTYADIAAALQHFALIAIALPRFRHAPLEDDPVGDVGGVGGGDPALPHPAPVARLR